MRARFPFSVVPILLFTVGCGSFFNQQRSDTATAAQKKFTDVKLGDLLKEERKYHAEIVAREVAIAQRQLAATRDARLISILVNEKPKDAATKAIQTRLRELRGEDQGIVNLLITIEGQEQGLRSAGDLYVIKRQRSDPKLECIGTDVQVSTRARGEWDEVQDRCVELAASRAEISRFGKAGLLGQTALRIATTERARTELAVRLKNAEKDARESAAALAAAQKQSKSGVLLDAAALAKLKENVTKIEIPSGQQLSSAGIDDVRVAALLRWTEMQRAAIEKVLAAATSGATEPPAGTSDALQIAAVLPSLAAQLREGHDLPRVSALVMESQRLRIDADRYKRQLARVDEELALQRAKLLRLRDETRIISDAVSKLNDNATVDEALAKYAEAWTVSRIPMKEIEWKLIALAHDRALDQSEAALAQWEALVRTPLEAVVASAGSGLKPEDVARLLHAIELGALAAGV